MLKFLSKRGKVMLTDAAGVFLIIVSPITGLVPGPGGVPVFLAGLGLLSINHEWARNLLNYIKTKGLELINKIFSDNPLLKWLYDLISIGLLFLTAWLILEFTSNLIQALAIVLGIAGISLFLGNRKRLHNIARIFRRK